MMLRILYIVLIINFLSGCGAAIRHLDAIWEDSQTVYPKGTSLPPLEIRPELMGQTETPSEKK